LSVKIDSSDPDFMLAFADGNTDTLTLSQLKPARGSDFDRLQRPAIDDEIAAQTLTQNSRSFAGKFR